MARTDLNLGENYKALSDLDDYRVEPGDPDPRGWTVVTRDGRSLGDVEDLVVDTSTMKVRYLVVDPAESADENVPAHQPVLIEVNDVDVRSDSRELLVRGGSYANAMSPDTASAPREGTAVDREARLTRSEEELRIGKREVSRGEVRVGKHVETEHVREPVTRRREEVVMERRPVEAGASEASIAEDEIRVPLVEEEVIVERRPVVKEELVVGKRTVDERDVVEADVKRERFDIDENVDNARRDEDRPSRRKD